MLQPYIASISATLQSMNGAIDASIGDLLGTAIRTTQGQLYRGFSPKELAALNRLQKKLLQNLSALMKQKEVPKLR